MEWGTFIARRKQVLKLMTNQIMIGPGIIIRLDDLPSGVLWNSGKLICSSAATDLIGVLA
jgi:hypothetical protein